MGVEVLPVQMQILMLGRLLLQIIVIGGSSHATGILCCLHVRYQFSQASSTLPSLFPPQIVGWIVW